MNRRTSVESVWSQHRNPQSALWQQYSEAKATQQPEATVRRLRDRLAAQNDKLALNVAYRASSQCQEPLEDLQQIARIGLLKAIERFDPSQGVAFSSFAVPYIKGEIGHFLRDHWSHLKSPRRSIEFFQKAQRIAKAFVAAGQSADEESIAISILLKGKGKFITAEQMQQAKARWQQIKQEASRAALVPLEEALHHSVELDNETDFELAAIAMRRLAELPKKQRRCVVESVFGNLTDEAIAASQGTTAAEVRLNLQEGLTRLRAGLEDRRQQG